MPTRTRLIALLVAGIIVTAALLAASVRPHSTAPPLPSPNGHDDFVNAALSMAGKVDFTQDTSEAELRALLSANTEALKSVRSGLTHQCRVPPIVSMTNMAAHITGLSSIKGLAQLLLAEGRLASMEGRKNDARLASIDILRFSQEATRGGPMIDALVRVACESYGLNELQSTVTNLNSKECRETIEALDNIEKTQESVTEILANEKEWRRCYPYHQRLMTDLANLFGNPSNKKIEKRFIQKIQTLDKQRRELMIQMAVQAYKLEKGDQPKSISDLVPDFLRTPPLDPLAETNVALKLKP